MQNIRKLIKFAKKNGTFNINKISGIISFFIENEMKRISLIKLYELGKIFSGQAAKLLSLSRVDFLELLQKYNVSYFQKNLENDLESDLTNA